MWKKLISKTLCFSKSDSSRVAPKTVNIFLRFLGSSRIISVLSEFRQRNLENIDQCPSPVGKSRSEMKCQLHYQQQAEISIILYSSNKSLTLFSPCEHMSVVLTNIPGPNNHIPSKRAKCTMMKYTNQKRAEKQAVVYAMRKHWLHVKYRIKFKIFLLTCKILNNQTSYYLIARDHFTLRLQAYLRFVNFSEVKREAEPSTVVL